ncbi:MAG: antibiotic biosynthesis monooxygenase [Bacteroidales bacterium]
MIVTCVHVHVKPDSIDAFLKATIENHKESVKEPGNLRFDVLRLDDDPNKFLLYEAYESEEAALKWREEVADFMFEPRKGVKYNIIEPKEKAQW